MEETSTVDIKSINEKIERESAFIDLLHSDYIGEQKSAYNHLSNMNDQIPLSVYYRMK